MNIVDLSWKLARQYCPAPVSEDLHSSRVRLAYVRGFDQMALIAEQQLLATLVAHGCKWREVEDIIQQWRKRIDALNGDEHKRVGDNGPRGYDKEGDMR